MGRATWLADVLKDAGLKLVINSGWETRGATDQLPLGVMLHHTVTPASDPISKTDKFLINGRSDLPGPLANYSTNRDGSISIIAAGVANHAGIGDWMGINAVKGVNGDDGNERFLGDEMKNDGREPWPKIQLDAARHAAAAILAHIGADAAWLCGHKEWANPPGRKPDPHTLNMNTVRADVAAIMEDDMPLTSEEIKAIADKVWSSTPGGVDFGTAWQTLVRVKSNTDKTLNMLGSVMDLAELTTDELEAIGDAVADELKERLDG